MNTHHEEALISLKRKYGREDLFRALISENEKLKAQIDELDEYRYNAEKKAENKFKEINKIIFRENKRLRDENIILRVQLNNK